MSKSLPIPHPEWNNLLEKRDALESQIAAVLTDIHVLADSKPVVIGRYAAAFSNRLFRLHDAEIDDATAVKPETESAVYDPGEWDVKSVAYNGDEKYEMVRTRYLQHMQMTEKVVKDPMIKENWSDAPISERFIAETQDALLYANQIISELRLPKVAGGWGTRC